MLASDAGLAPQLCSVRDRARVYPGYSRVQGSLSNLSGPYFLHETAKRSEIETISCQRSTLEAQTEHRWGDTLWWRAGWTPTSSPRCSVTLTISRANELKVAFKRSGWWEVRLTQTLQRAQRQKDKSTFQKMTTLCKKTACVHEFLYTLYKMKYFKTFFFFFALILIIVGYSSWRL